MVFNTEQQKMASLFCNMNYVVSNSVEELDNDNKKNYQHVQKYILITDEEEQYIPIPDYSLLTPTMSLQFLNQIMLSLGGYTADLDMSLQRSIRENFRNAKLNGINDDEES